MLDRLRPDLLRPHWLLVERLPASIPAGDSQVFVEGEQGWTTARIPMRVSPVSPSPTRVLFPGRPVEWPYTIAFIANPAIQNTRDEIVPDPVRTRTPRFIGTVLASLRTLLTLDEDLLRHGGLEPLIRFIVVLDPDAAVTEQNALAQEYAPVPSRGVGRGGFSASLRSGSGRGLRNPRLAHAPAGFSPAHDGRTDRPTGGVSL
jgi:hypothetical protein